MCDNKLRFDLKLELIRESLIESRSSYARKQGYVFTMRGWCLTALVAFITLRKEDISYSQVFHPAMIIPVAFFLLEGLWRQQMTKSLATTHRILEILENLHNPDFEDIIEDISLLPKQKRILRELYWYITALSGDKTAMVWYGVLMVCFMLMIGIPERWVFKLIGLYILSLVLICLVSWGIDKYLENSGKTQGKGIWFYSKKSCDRNGE